MTRPKKIGLNLLLLHPELGGIRNSGSSLCQAILEEGKGHPGYEFELFVTDVGKRYLDTKPSFVSAVEELGDRCEVVTVPVNPRRKLRRFFYEQSGFVRRVNRLDLLHSFDYVMPFLSKCPSIVMIRDLNYLNHADTFTLAQRSIRRFAVPLSIRRAAKIATISMSAKREIQDRFGVPEDRMAVVYDSFGDQRTTSERDKRDPETGNDYVLSVGTLKVHKNYPRLLEAFSQISDPTVRLVIVGRDDGLADSLKEQARDLGIAERVKILGFVSDEELEDLYLGASMLVFPSLYEGFGMPLLEAMESDIPVACSNIDVFREIGGEATVRFDPTQVNEITEAIDRVLQSKELQRGLVEAGRARVQEFTWRKSAERVFELYEEIALAS